MAGKEKAKAKQKASRNGAEKQVPEFNRLAKWFSNVADVPLNWGLSSDAEIGQLTGSCRVSMPAGDAAEERFGEIASGFKRKDIPSVFELLKLLWCLPNGDEAIRVRLNSWNERFFASGARGERSAHTVPDETLFYQLAEIELPLAWVAVLPSTVAEQNARLAVDRMADLVSDVLDSDGIPSATIISVLPQLLASWTRCSRMLKKLGCHFDPESSEILEWLVQQILRWLAPDGSLMLGGTASQPFSKDFRKYVLKMSSDPIDKHLAKYCFPPTGRDKLSRRELPETSSCSAWGEMALLQSYWKCGLPKVSIDFSQGRNRIELASQVKLLAGDITPQVSINGKPVLNQGHCDVVCWHQDEDLDYLEIEFQMSGGVVIQRQYILVRQDQILVVLDVVNSQTAGRIDYDCCFPLADGISLLSESETAEVYLKSGGEIESLVMPLGLAEWTVDRHEGSLGVQQDHLRLHQSMDGNGLCASLFFDLNRVRSLRPRTWRRLHVVEKLEQVARDRAVAYRVQLDQQQWLIYRSIGENANRTFLGENVSQDFYMGRFFRDGSVEELIQIEQ